jgi:dTDP-4-dehydrorhamnose reductase
LKKILIAGANGLLGQKLTKFLGSESQLLATGIEPSLELDAQEYHYEVLDITNPASCKEFITSFQPDVVINAASITNVDACEKERELCWSVNVKGVENLAKACKLNMAMLIHISTDYIFDGENGPYKETDKPNPLGYYGKSKLASENVCRMTGIPYAILRTSVLFGLGTNVKANFFLWLYNKLRNNEPVNIVTDQFNTPTLVDDLALGIKLLIKKSSYGVFNVSGEAYLNRFDFANLLAKTFEFSSDLITPVKTEQLEQVAIRPIYAGLDNAKAKNELDYHPRKLIDAFKHLKMQLQAESKLS